MNQFLEKFKDVIHSRQVEQIIKILNQKKETGEIKDINEFTQQLDNLVREISNTVLTPTLKIVEQKDNSIIDSVSWNEQVEHLGNDINAAFEEVDNLENIRDSHNILIKDMALKNIQASISELDSKITVFEVLNKTNNGFNNALFTTFREVKEDRTILSETNKSFFIDPKTGQSFSSNEVAFVDPVGERLTLGTNTGTTIEYVNTVKRVYGGTSLKSQFDTTRKDLELSNIIDNNSSTYWAEALLFLGKKDYVDVTIQIDFGGSVKNVGFLDIKPAIHDGCYFQELKYINSLSKTVTIATPAIYFDSPISYLFAPVSAKALIVTFRSDISKPIEISYIDKPEKETVSQLNINENNLETLKQFTNQVVTVYSDPTYSAKGI